MISRGGTPAWVRCVSLLVPADERREWCDEWRGELEELRRRGAPLLRRVTFGLGAVPHAWSLRRHGAGAGLRATETRIAARALLRRPGFTAVAALTLALGIAVNAALFSLVDSLLLRPPPGIVAPERMVQLARSYDSAPRWDNFSLPAILAIGEAATAFESVAGYTTRGFVVGGGVDAEVVAGTLVTGGYFATLGIRPHLGRGVDPSDDRPGAEPVVVLSHDFWTRRWGADPAILGRSIRIGDASHRVVGVAARGFSGVDKLGSAPDLYVPTTAFHAPGIDPDALRTLWGMSWLDGVARLRADVSIAEARAALDDVSARLRAASPDNGDIRVLLAEGVGLAPGDRAEAMRLAALMAVVAGLVLLLTCANVAGLFLARSVDRTGEFALRRTLGAGAGHLVRQLLTESVLLAALAAVMALPLTVLAALALPTLLPSPVTVSFAPDPRVFGVVGLLGLAAGVLFGGGPALLAARHAPARSLESARTTAGGRTHRLRSALVVGQLALSLGLLTGAGVLSRSVRAALTARPGLEPAGVLTAALDLDLTGRYGDPSSRRAFVDALLTRLRAEPGVAAAAAASIAPFWGGFSRMSRGPLDGDPTDFVEADAVFADPGWFQLLGIDPIEGRLYDPRVDTEPVAVVNQRTALTFWPGRSAVGRYLRGERPIRIVGVVPDVRFRSLRSAPNPAVYEPLDRAAEGRVMVHVRARTGVTPMELLPTVRATVAALDPALPVTRVADLRAAMAATLGETRNLGRVVAAVAALALLLAGLGLYASVSYAVARRSRELAVRVAMGARPAALFAAVLRRGAALAAAGLLFGTGVAWALGRALEGSLYGVGALDLPTLLGVGFLQAAIAVVACAVPARRATHLDPAQTLRRDA